MALAPAPQDLPDHAPPDGALPARDLSQSRLALVLNGGAGRRDAHAQRARIEALLAPRVKSLQTYPVSKGREIAAAAAQAAAEGAGVVVALGGDGTQSAVAGALVGTGTAMGVLPGGTFNYFARELGVGDTLDAAVQTILSGQQRAVDVGDINGHVFLNNASFGVYPAILERREAIYRRWGRSRIAAYGSVLLALRDMRDPMHLSLTIDGATQDYYTPLVFAARSAFQLEHLGLDGAEAVRAGRFALFLARGKTPRALTLAAFRLAFGQMAHGQDFELLLGDDILIETRQPRRLIAFDGEKARIRGPFRLRIRRAALQVLAPLRPALAGAAGPAAA